MRLAYIKMHRIQGYVWRILTAIIQRRYTIMKQIIKRV